MKLTTFKYLLSVLFLSVFWLYSFNRSIAQEVKVMTYNIYHGEQHYSLGESNLEQVAKVINTYKPDFVALQEVDSMTNRTATFNNGIKKDLIQELAKMTNMYGFFGKAIDYSNGGYGEGILSRFPVSSTNYNLPIPEGGEGRALLMIDYIFPNGQKIIFAGTHLCHQFSKNRLAQAKAICDYFSHHDIPIIIGGDFNFRPDTEPYQLLMNCFKDAAVMKGGPQNTISFENPRARIDYIFVSKEHDWKIKDVKVIRNNASDHLPVMVTLELNN